MQVLDLNELLAKFTKLLGRILGENVRVHSEFGPALPSIKADAGMIEQIVMNLAVNARDAMPAGGALTIRTEMQDFGAAEVSRHPGSREGSFVCLSVSDAGSGIAPENMARIFEPFFSTKGPGKGTGLGLATVFGIAQQHGGWVGVSSQPGAGTTFRVFLPATAEQLAPADANPGKKIRGGGEKILVVEDDAALREVVTEILLGEGYSVLGAGSGPAARQAWKKDFRSIDLLLADMLVPGAETGLELAGVFRKEKPELKVVLMSGYTTQLVSSEMLSSKRLTFLRKPFLPHVLAEMVRASLDAREPLKINNGATVDGSASHGNQGSEKVEFEHAKAMS